MEHEYERGRALQYLATWDIQVGRVAGRCEEKTGIEPFGRLVDQVMTLPEYRTAPHVFWVVDNGSSHRGEAFVRRMRKAYPPAGDAGPHQSPSEAFVRRMRKAYPNAVLVHTPVHASWLNQVEIYFSIIQRKVLTPNDFASLADLEQQLLRFQHRYEQSARPFEWTFTRNDLAGLLNRIDRYERRLAA